MAQPKLEIVGTRGSRALVAAGDTKYIVDTERGSARQAAVRDTRLTWHAPARRTPVDRILELAAGQRALEHATSATPQPARAYTVPAQAAAVASAALAGGPITRDSATITASVLSAGRQITYDKLQHIGAYFAQSDRDKRLDQYWGGEPARTWVANLLRRNTLSLTASGFELANDDAAVFEDDSILLLGAFNPANPFEIEAILAHNPATETTMVWDAGSWHEITEAPDWLDSLAVRLVELDGETAAAAAAEFDVHPGKRVHLATINPEETGIAILAGFDNDDWDAIDALIAAGPVSDGERPGDGVYTTEERKRKAKNQPRDRNGKFATEGARGTLKDGRWAEIRGINQTNGELLVEADDGNVYSIPSRQFEIRDSQPQPGVPIDQNNSPEHLGEPGPGEPVGMENHPKTPLAPLDLSRILAQPRATAGAAKATLDVTLPPLTATELREIIDNYSEFILEERRANASKFPIRGDGALPVSDSVSAMNPDTSDVKPIYLALVEPDDPQTVKELVALAPASSQSNQAATFKRADGAWVRDDEILADMRSPTPPAVVKLTDELYESVLSQIDTGKIIASVFAAAVGDMVLLSAGSRAKGHAGGAERLRIYWTTGKGGLKIRWNTPGDWTRCVRQLRKYLGPRAKGYCQNLHKRATGVYTGSRNNVGRKRRRG